MTDPRLQAFVYERGEGRTKHVWSKDEAGFMPTGDGPVGKCHKSISEPLAQSLLRGGIVAESAYEDNRDFPDEIFNIYRGVPYVAVSTQPGRSYHGYPWAGRMSATVRQHLEGRATEEGTLKEFKKWLKLYSVR